MLRERWGGEDGATSRAAELEAVAGRPSVARIIDRCKRRCKRCRTAREPVAAGRETA
jgi:hypothetical protein